MNQKRYWLRGGITLVVISIIIALFRYPSGIPACTGGFCDSFPYWLHTFFPGELVTIWINMGFSEAYIYLSTIIGLIIYFIVGAVIGWIYGKVKAR